VDSNAEMINYDDKHKRYNLQGSGTKKEDTRNKQHVQRIGTRLQTQGD